MESADIKRALFLRALRNQTHELGHIILKLVDASYILNFFLAIPKILTASNILSVPIPVYVSGVYLSGVSKLTCTCDMAPKLYISSVCVC